MRILLVHPPVRPTALPNNVPLGIYHVGAMIHRLRPKAVIKYVDLNAYRPELDITAARVLLDWPCDVVMISGLLTTYKWQKQLAWMFSSINPQAKIILGGGLASNLRSKVLEWLPADSVCVGEAEPVLPQMLDDLEANRLDRVYRGKPPMDLDALPSMDWDEVDELEKYIVNPIWGAGAANSSYAPFHSKRSLSIITSRGCPRSCKFCNRDVLGGRKYRMRSSKHVATEVFSLVEKYGIDFMGFVDDNFAVSKTRLADIAERLQPLAMTDILHWGGHPRFDEVDDLEFLKHLAKSGCVYLGFGGESANVDILKDMEKGNEPEQMARVIGYCREVGIFPNTTFMWGWDGETREQIRDTVRFMLKHTPEQRSLFHATAYMNTGLFAAVKDKVWAKWGSLKKYVEQLADATKPLVNISAMDDNEWAEVMDLIQRGELEKI